MFTMKQIAYAKDAERECAETVRHIRGIAEFVPSVGETTLQKR